MGVDITTYRARVGTFKHAFGQDVVTHNIQVDIPTVRRILIWEILCVLVLIMALYETSFVKKNPHEFTTTIHGLWNDSLVTDFLTTLSLYSIVEFVGYYLLLATIIPDSNETRSTCNETSSLCGDDGKRNDKCDSSVKSVMFESNITKSISIFCNIGSLSFVGMLLLIAGVEPNPGPLGGKSELTATKVPLLHRLDLNKYFPGKIELFDVISITQEDITSLDGRQEKKLPWILLRKLVFLNDNAFCLDDPTENKLQDPNSMLVDEEEGPDDYQKVEKEISYLDIFVLVYQCCCPMLQQLLCQKMFLCKFAFPFLFTPFDDDTPKVTVWPLRSLVVETISNEKSVLEYDVLELPTKCIAFCRIGRPEISKSQLLNILVSDERSKTFFNCLSQSGLVPKFESRKYIETFWLLKSGTDRDHFDETTMVLNMRGCIRNDFDKPTMTLIGSFVDAVSVFIQKDDITKRESEIKELASLFKTIIIIIVGSSKIKELNSFLQDLKEYALTDHECDISVVQTYDTKSKRDKLDDLITREIINAIKIETDKQPAKPFETRLQECDREMIRTDEDVDAACQYGKKNALDFLDYVKLETNFLSLKREVTPIQSTIARYLGELLKSLKREKDKYIQETKRELIHSVRMEIATSITNSIKQFLNILCSDITKAQLVYFLAWLEFYISRQYRLHIPRLNQEHIEAWENYRKHKHDDPQNINKNKKLIEKIQSRIDAATFSVGHVFREIGLIYDTVCELKRNEKILNIPPMDLIASVIGTLMLNGRHLELIDGDSFYLPTKWLSKIFGSKLMCRKTVMTISVLGVQSSGKSTLLNTMFGALFSTSAGRCTRGIHAQLIPLHDDLISKGHPDCRYVLVLDTEGLRSTEVFHKTHEHDNELATLISGLGNTTIVNVMGENTQEIKDILQIVAHAFVRIKLSNDKIALKNRCVLVQHNINVMSGSNKLRGGLNTFITELDEMAQDSARYEGDFSIRTFSDVIHFDVSSDVCFLPNVWHGNPPFVNRTYSDEANKMKYRLCKQIPNDKTLSQFICQTNDLWQGVLNENFVFSFKNSLERRAYLEMDDSLQTMLWNCEFNLTQYMHSNVQKKFSDCQTIMDINTSDGDINSLLNTKIKERRTAANAELEVYFERSQNRMIIAQWYENQRQRFERFFDKMHVLIEDNVRHERQKFKTNLRFHDDQRKNMEALHQKTLEYSQAHDVRDMTKEGKHELFDKFWTDDFGNYDTYNDTDQCDLGKAFIDSLYDIHKSQQTLLKQILEKEEWDQTSAKLLTELSFNKTGIGNDDMVSDTHNIFGRVSSDKRRRVRVLVKDLFATVTGKINKLCADCDHISESDVHVLLHNLSKKQKSAFSNRGHEVKERCYIKMNVHVSIYANRKFEEHNNIYRQAMRDKCSAYKREQKRLFMECLECRETEDSLADIIASIIMGHVNTESNDQLYLETQTILHGDLPSTKNRLVVEVCTGLVDANDFEKVISYIRDPYKTAQEWYERKALHFLLEKEKFKDCSLRVLETLQLKVIESLTGLKRTDDVMISTDELIKRLQSSLNENKVHISHTNFDTVLSWHKLSEVNIKTVCNKIKSKLGTGIESLKTEHENYTDTDIRKLKGKSPFLVMFERIWGCTEVCPYCNEPCEKSAESHTEDHTCVQHRPQCCRGQYFTHTEQANSDTCSYAIQSSKKHTCSAFGFKCNDRKSDCKLESHKYRKYRETLKTWHIQPSADMHDSSKFWLWVAGTFKNELKERYRFEIDEIPDEWSNISPEDAKDSLRSVYG